MVRYVGRDGWLDVDEQGVSAGQTGASYPLATMALTSLATVSMTPVTGGGQLSLVFAGVGLPANGVVAHQLNMSFDDKDAATFEALREWLDEAAELNRGRGLPVPTGTTSPAQVEAQPTLATAVPVPTALDSTKGRNKDDVAKSAHSLALQFVAGDDVALAPLLADLSQLRSQLRASRVTGQVLPMLADAIEASCQDDRISTAAEARLNQLVTALGLTWETARAQIPQQWDELFIARANDGRMPVLDASHLPIILKPGETVHGDYAVSLMKQQVRREYTGGSAGVSVPIGHGLRVRTGSMRGHSVAVGTELVVQDQGHLVVTSSRTIFVGAGLTLEFAYAKLVGLQRYADGLALSVSNRQATSLFRFSKDENPKLAAALIAASAA